ncbi:YciI family protein [Gimesia aquarii]|uniref:YCII-related domain protein n=1 Tax=Gimesia aquarii TaxID=2527964 RepID=A0A517W0L3_9PLAN|nr:YciI family protein [Gimesia aquarii]QDT98792.1 YCII-related domain protein [Gimesia aquarii]
MKFLCLGYYDAASMEGKTEAEMAAFMEECFAYDDELRCGGHFTGGEALQPAEHAVTLRHRGGQVETTDGPFAETKEQIGGILILEARDMNQAVELMSKHPGVRFGPFEIRPADEHINALIKARDEAMR